MRTKRKPKPSLKPSSARKKSLRIDADVYNRLVAMAGKRDLSRYVASLIPPATPREVLEAGYRAMAADHAGEAEALEWAEALLGDIRDEAR